MSARVLKEVVLWVSESPLNFAICSYMAKRQEACFYSKLRLSIRHLQWGGALHISREREKLLASFSSIKQ